LLSHNFKRFNSKQMADLKSILYELKQERDCITSAIDALEYVAGNARTRATGRGHKSGRISAEARARIAAAQRARLAKQKKAAKVS
jgi:hypothetical protein